MSSNMFNSPEFTAGEFVSPATNSNVSLTRLSDVQPERVTWLWQGWLPRGKPVTLDGDPGLGKSTLSDEFAAVVTTGGMWPDGTRCEYPGSVLLMSAEDGLADTVRPRLDAAGADVTKVHAIEGVPIFDEETGERTLRPPTLADILALEEAVTQTDARLLVVDVIMAYLPSGTDSHRDQDIRKIMSRLAAVGDKTGCTVLLLRHLNKAKGGDPLYRGGGSIGIVGAARAGMLVAPDRDDPDRRILASVKSNLGQRPESQAYRLVDAGTTGVARVHWEGSTEHTAFTLLSTPDSDDEQGSSTEAERWLEDYLTEQGSASSKVAKAAAAKVGIKERTLQRAVKSLRVNVESRGFPRVTWWELNLGNSDVVSPASDVTTPPVTSNLGATGATGDDLREHNGATGPETQSRQAASVGTTVPPGGLTESTPGQTDRVKRALAGATLTIVGVDRCPECGFHVPTQKHRDGCPERTTA